MDLALLLSNLTYGLVRESHDILLLLVSTLSWFLGKFGSGILRVTVGVRRDFPLVPCESLVGTKATVGVVPW